MKTPNDWDQEEDDALRLVGDELAELRRHHASDPPFDLLRAADGDALPTDLQSATAAHLAGSRWSRALVENANAASEQIKPDQEDRVLEHVRRAAGARGRQWPAWFSLLATTALVVLAVVIVQRFRAAPPAPATASVAEATPPPTSAVAQFQIPLQKPELKLSPRSLTYRGDASNDDFALRIKPGFDAYRNDDYSRAAVELGTLATGYPQSVEVFFYQGVSRLFLNDLAGADMALSAADRIGDSSFASEIAWYRAVVDERTGRRADAQARLAALCQHGDQRWRAAACEAADKLK